MSDELVIRYCAPTLASIKTANLFSCIFANQQKTQEHIRNMSTVDSVDLVKGKVTVHMGEMSLEGMFGGIS